MPRQCGSDRRLRRRTSPLCGECAAKLTLSYNRNVGVAATTLGEALGGDPKTSSVEHFLVSVRLVLDER